MGYDTIVYGEHDALFSDSDLWLIRHFMLKACDALGESNPEVSALHDFMQKWDWAEPGIVNGTNIGRFVKGSPERLAVLVSALHAAVEVVRAFGQEVPAEYLQANCNHGSMLKWVGPLPVDAIVHELTRVNALITEGRS